MISLQPREGQAPCSRLNYGQWGMLFRLWAKNGADRIPFFVGVAGDTMWLFLSDVTRKISCQCERHCPDEEKKFRTRPSHSSLLVQISVEKGRGENQCLLRTALLACCLWSLHFELSKWEWCHDSVQMNTTQQKSPSLLFVWAKTMRKGCFNPGTNRFCHAGFLYLFVVWAKVNFFTSLSVFPLMISALNSPSS